MKNKEYLKKYLLFTLVVAFIASIFFMFLANKEYFLAKKNYNVKINAIVSLILEKYPDISEEELINLLQTEKGAKNVLAKYGYNLEKDALIIENNEVHIKFILSECILIIAFCLILFYIFLNYNLKVDKEIDKIIKLIEDINHKNYEMNLSQLSEDKLSILKNEIYKTTIMLKENAENSFKDKLNIKNSLQDISHQLKTPLTSILIMLDNIIDNPDMEEKQKEHFIMGIKKEIANINFLVQSILKLSRLEVNSIIFLKDQVQVDNIINKAINNVINLCDLKNVAIEVKGDIKASLKCDKSWQTEAITNILKNAVEHSLDNDKVVIEVCKNKVYTQIAIKDYGKGIDKEDQKHIFERFYKGQNASEDSVGIGLALAKTIIEKDGGKVEVESKKEKGTTFYIKYFNY